MPRVVVTAFRQRYGSWALVAGASVGLGAAFARALAHRAMDLILVARRDEPLRAFARAVGEKSDVRVVPVVADVGSHGFSDQLAELARNYDIGVGVYNAAFAPVGPLLERSHDELRAVVGVNVLGPLLFARVLAAQMVERQRGGLVLMSSLAGQQGTPRLAAYSASKAFNTVLAEALWHELRGKGVDVIASVAGAIRTPGYNETKSREAPGVLDPDEVAERTLSALGGGARVVPGWVNLLASIVMGRILPRRAAIALMAASTKALT